MQHLNNNKLVAIEIRATGPNVEKDELLQISALALDSNCDADKTILPFNMFVRPINLRDAKTRDYENICPGADINTVTFSLLKKALKEGHDQWKVTQLFTYWFESFKLPYNHRIMPLCHNWAVKRPFLRELFGPLNFDHMFDWRYRDPIPSGLLMNDKCDVFNERCIYPKHTFNYMLTLHHRKRHPLKDALLDCQDLAAVYKSMIRGFNPHSLSSTVPSPPEST